MDSNELNWERYGRMVTSLELNRNLKKVFGGKGLFVPLPAGKSQIFDKTSRYIHLTDSTMFAPKIEFVKKLLKDETLAELQGKYVHDGFDCEDFAFALRGHLNLTMRLNYDFRESLAIGIVAGYFSFTQPGSYHYCNVVYTAEGKYFLIEPQQLHLGVLSPSMALPNSVRLFIL